MSNVKDWLNRARNIERDLEVLLAERNKLLELATKVTKAPKKDNVKSTGENMMERAMTKYANCSAEIDRRVGELCHMQNEIESVIDKVEDNKLRGLLRCRYISCMTWEETADTLGMSYYHVVHRMHPKALCEVQKILENNF